MDRVRKINNLPEKMGNVIYWMSRDQRVDDNYALLYAQEKAFSNGLGLRVVFYLAKSFLFAKKEHYAFMLNGLKECSEKLKKYNIPMDLLNGNFTEAFSEYLWTNNAGILVTDFSPLKIKREWMDSLKKEIFCAFYEVDTHNVVPVWTASEKQEFSARTIRSKIKKLLPYYFIKVPSLKTMDDSNFKIHKKYDSSTLLKENDNCFYCSINPGENAAKIHLKQFIKDKLPLYNLYRNDPNKMATSSLSPYLHFGQIFSLTVALQVKESDVSDESKQAFLEELIIRKELSDNYCFYNKNYDNFEGLHPWAKETLNKHRNDKRDYVYHRDIFEEGETHDDLWNASQLQLIKTGKIHGYLRMYWAKKILEWSKTPEIAIETAIFLNDTYALDGRDPNGYVGILWSVGGLHDRAWAERPVYGKIRYMNKNGCKRKFDVENFVYKYTEK